MKQPFSLLRTKVQHKLPSAHFQIDPPHVHILYVILIFQNVFQNDKNSKLSTKKGYSSNERDAYKIPTTSAKVAKSIYLLLELRLLNT